MTLRQNSLIHKRAHNSLHVEFLKAPGCRVVVSNCHPFNAGRPDLLREEGELGGKIRTIEELRGQLVTNVVHFRI